MILDVTPPEGIAAEEKGRERRPLIDVTPHGRPPTETKKKEFDGRQEERAIPEQAQNGDGEGGEGKGADNAVSLLQEMIQSSCSFSPHTKILTWGFEQQLAQGTLEFRATVSFVLGSAPHHFCGGWQTSKKKAQRDAAERVTHYLQHTNCSSLFQITVPSAEQADESKQLDIQKLPEDLLNELQALLQGSPIQDEHEPVIEWKLEDRPIDGSHECRAVASFFIDDVPHNFTGGWCSGSNDADGLTKELATAARRDTVERVLWYFGEGNESFAAPDGAKVSMEPTLPQPQNDSAVSLDKQPQLEDKTVLMQVQNTLQKAFAKDTPPGQKVWIWNYEGDPNDPQVFRACVDIPSWGRRFVGGWCRGKKLAQRNACLVVKDNLGSLETH
jgi:hypothetical protein